MITPIVAELAQALGRPLENTEEALRQGAAALMAATGCEIVLVTRGERGMMVASRDGAVFFEATARRVIDVSGAGDTVVASFALALVAETAAENAARPADVAPAIARLEHAARLASAAAGIAVSKKGTSQVSVDELRDVLLSRPHFELREKISDMDAIADRVAQWRRDGLTVGFTNGCFDLLHPGHVHLLCEARSRCDKLVVGLNSDASVKRLKGDSRPVQSETARAIVMAGLAFVDAVVLFASDTPLELIGRVRPDVLVKGADYRIEDVVGRELVESYGGRVVLVELVADSSTTRIIDKLKTANAARLAGVR